MPISPAFQYGDETLTPTACLELARCIKRGAIGALALARVKKSQKTVMAIVASGQTVYGINTGFGPLCKTRISAQDTRILQHNLLISHSVGVGDPVSPEISRLMLALKIQSLSKGYSGVAPETLKRILWHLDHEVIPCVPAQGSVGASGDLAPLAHLFLPLIGRGEVWLNGKACPASAVLRKHGIKPMALGPKEGLALINGTQFITAHAVLFLEKFGHCLDAADIIGAMTLEASLGSAKPFGARLNALRPYPGVALVAKNLRACLNGSLILNSHAGCTRVQDPYSLRCMPQVHGSAREAWRHLHAQTAIELNAVTDNPVIMDDGAVSGGLFHGEPLAMPLDYAGLAASELGAISDRRTYLILEGDNEGLPRLLMKNTGINSGLMILQYTTAALASENKTLCFPASADSIPTSLGQEDHVSMGAFSGRKALMIVANLEKILAIELICSAQALDYRRPLKSGPVMEAVHSAVRKLVPHAENDREWSRDIVAVGKFIASGRLSRFLESTARACDTMKELA